MVFVYQLLSAFRPHIRLLIMGLNIKAIDKHLKKTALEDLADLDLADLADLADLEQVVEYN